MATYVYRTDKSGNVRRLLVSERMKYRQGESIGSLEERMRKLLYQKECAEGSRFKSSHSKETLKRTWFDNAKERHAA